MTTLPTILPSLHATGCGSWRGHFGDEFAACADARRLVLTMLIYQSVENDPRRVGAIATVGIDHFVAVERGDFDMMVVLLQSEPDCQHWDVSVCQQNGRRRVAQAAIATVVAGPN